MATEFSFVCLNNTYGGVLNPNDVRLFYYDICFDKENRCSFPYKWNDKIESFLNEKNITMEVKEKKELENEFETNKLYFNMLPSDEENKAFALFRHLRNAFMHYTIGGDETYFCMKDFEPARNETPATLTMIGKIEKTLFYDMINLFFQQKEIKEEIHNNYLRPEI